MEVPTVKALLTVYMVLGRPVHGFFGWFLIPQPTSVCPCCHRLVGHLTFGASFWMVFAVDPGSIHPSHYLFFWGGVPSEGGLTPTRGPPPIKVHQGFCLDPGLRGLGASEFQEKWELHLSHLPQNPRGRPWDCGITSSFVTMTA